MTIAVLSSLALKGVLEQFRPAFERELGSLALEFDATQSILKRISTGERADLLILTAEALADLLRERRVTQVQALGSSGVGLAVRAGAPKPRIGTVDEFVKALTMAKSVAHSKVGASGLHFVQLVNKLGIQLKNRIAVEKGPVGLLVARGEAELGIQQLCELAPVPGIDIVGPLPDPLQVTTLFSAGIPADAANPQAAKRLLDLLRAERAAMTQGGLQPAD